MLETESEARPHCPLPRGRWPRAGMLAVCLGLGGLSCLLPCLQADPAPRHALQRDLEVRVRARSVLKADPQLQIEELVVDVHDGMAVLEGEVPSQEMRRRAQELLSTVRGIREVTNNLRIVARPGRVDLPILPPLQDSPTQTRSQSSPSQELPSSEVRPQAPPPPPQSQRYTTLPPPAFSSTSPAPASPLVAPQAMPPRRGPARAIPAARSVGQPMPPASVHVLPPSELGAPSEVKPPPPADDLRERVEQIRQSNEHFRFVQADVSGDSIVVQGENGAYVMELARQLTHLPGARRVIVKVRPAPR